MAVIRIMIFGAAGMLGHTLFTRLVGHDNFEVYATVRSSAGLSKRFSPELMRMVRGGVDADNFDTVIRAIAEIKPDVVINCIGIIKQLPAAEDHLTAITINALFPHRLALVCAAAGARLIHISTDCVFAGTKGGFGGSGSRAGGYTEQDPADATDLYGRTKYLGEVTYPHCVTLRTSIIGHELNSQYGLVEWFLAQPGKVRGFTNAIYSGFPTVELARIIAEYVLPIPELSGLYHVSSETVSKYALLKLIAVQYGKQTEIEPYHDFRVDRLLDSSRFRGITGYNPPAWPELIAGMHGDFTTAPHYRGGK
jgi:dTDP-4-dehydrorhamnose reductase